MNGLAMKTLARRVRLWQVVQAGERLPWWMGLAYWEWQRPVAVCCVMPCHLLLRWGRDLYVWLKATHRPDWWASELEAARQTGYEEGRHDGHMEELTEIARSGRSR